MDRSPYSFREGPYGERQPLFQGQPTTLEKMLAEQQIQQASMDKSWPVGAYTPTGDEDQRQQWSAAHDINSNINAILRALRNKHHNY
jgi:hypothetical protein